MALCAAGEQSAAHFSKILSMARQQVIAITWHASHPGLDLTHGDVVDRGLLAPWTLGDHHLHQEDIFIAVVPQHVVIYLGHDSIFVLPVQEPDVGGVNFVLVLYG